MHGSIAAALCRALPPMASQRLFMTLRSRRRSAPPRKFVATTITGSRFSFVTGDLLADTLRACGFWDWRNLAIAAALCAPGDRIIEVGANTGTETLGFSDIVGPRGHVHAFEPEPALAQALRDNLEMNARTNVTIHTAAVADRNGTARFERSRNRVNSGTGHIAAAGRAETLTVEVPMVTLDALAQTLGPAKLLAVDVEGSELAVLRGASRYLASVRPAIVVEACAALLSRGESSLADLVTEVERHDYLVFEIGKLRLRPLVLDQLSDAYEKNWLCVPRERRDVRKRVDRTLVCCALAPRVPGLNPIVYAPLRSRDGSLASKRSIERFDVGDVTRAR
jgi:FkbM family methyltransferase